MHGSYNQYMTFVKLIIKTEARQKMANIYAEELINLGIISKKLSLLKKQQHGRARECVCLGRTTSIIAVNCNLKLESVAVLFT